MECKITESFEKDKIIASFLISDQIVDPVKDDAQASRIRKSRLLLSKIIPIIIENPSYHYRKYCVLLSAKRTRVVYER